MRKYWVALSSIEEIGSSFIQRLYHYFGDIESAFNATDLSQIEGLNIKKAEKYLRLRDKLDVDKIVAEVENRGINYLTFDDEKSNEEITIPEIKPINEDNDELENTKILDTVYENEEKGNTEVLDVVYDDKLPTEIIEENNSTTEKFEEPVIEQVIESNVEMPVYEFAAENQLETSIIQNVEIPTVEQINIEPVQESIYERLGNTEIIEVPTVETQEDNIKEEPVIISSEPLTDSEPIIIATTAVPEKMSGEEE